MSEGKMDAPSGGGRNGAVEGHSRAANDKTENTPNGGDPQDFDFASFENLGSKPNGGTAPPRKYVGAVYRYTDEHGNLLYKKTRIYTGGLDANGKPAKITPFARWDPQDPQNVCGWVGGTGCMDRVQQVPYRLPQLLAAIAEEREIVIVEGEKKTAIALRLGIPTTSIDRWTPEIARLFDSVRVAILPDNDSSGTNKALKAATALSGVAKRVRIVPLPVTGKGHDLEQWIAGGGTREQLAELIEQAPDFVLPPPEPETEQSALEREPWSPSIEARVCDALRYISADIDRDDGWWRILAALHSTGWSRALEIAHEWSKGCPERYDANAVDAAWRSFHADGIGGRAVRLGTLFGLAQKNGWNPAAPDLSEFGSYEQVFSSPGGAEQGQTGQAGNTSWPFNTGWNLFNPANFEGVEVQERRWIVDNYIPDATVTLLSADGGSGKDYLKLQLGVARALGRLWIGLPVTPGRTLIVSDEDDAQEVHRRLDRIREFYEASWADLADVRLVDLVGKDCVLGAFDRKQSKVIITDAWKALDRAIAEFQPSLVCLGNLANMFGGDEISRPQVTQFVGLLQHLCQKHRCGILVLSHPSLTGMSSGSGISGSTAWHNAVRARIYLAASQEKNNGVLQDTGMRAFHGKKNQYGVLGGAFDVVWRQGLFQRVDASDAEISELRAENIFLEMLQRRISQGRHVSDKTSANYAPAQFEKEEEVKSAGLNRKHLEAAMLRLFNKGRIRIETVRGDGKDRHSIAISADSANGPPTTPPTV